MTATPMSFNDDGTTSNPAGEKVARDLAPGDKVDYFVVCLRPEPAGTRGHLWWKKEQVKVVGICVGLVPYRSERIFDADEVLTLNPHD